MAATFSSQSTSADAPVLPVLCRRRRIQVSHVAGIVAPAVELCAIQPPGRESRLREPPYTRLAPLVQMLTQAVLPYCGVPFAVFGHSLGALVAFELARQLLNQLLRTLPQGPSDDGA